jgi:uncharacterized membrane protein
MIRCRLARLGFTILLLSLPLAGQATPVNPWQFMSMSIPEATETWVRGINNNGEIVGFYKTANSTCLSVPSDAQVPICTVRGFKIADGVLVKLNVPNALSTAILGVNDSGDLVGFYLRPTNDCPVGVYHGFLWQAASSEIKNLDFLGTALCGSGVWSVPMGINKAGTIVGTRWDVQNGQPSGGFIWRGGNFTAMDIGGEGGSGVNGISNNGMLVGSAWYTPSQIPMWTGWIKKGADEKFFTMAQDDTFAAAINNATDVVGWGTPGAGFFKNVQDQKSFLHLTIGDATWPFGINDNGAVVGSYRDNATGIIHGFLASTTFKAKAR